MNTSTNQANMTAAVIPTYNDDIAYTILGFVGISLNLLVFAVLITDKALLRKSVLLAGIALGNLQLGIYLTWSGMYRLVCGISVQLPASLVGCVSTIWPLLYTMAFNTEASFLFLSGLERFLAIAAANWFRQKWTNTAAWRLSLASYLFIWTTLALSLMLPSDRSALTWGCALTTMYGLNYVRFSSAFSCIAGLASATLTLLALILCIQRIRKLPLASGEAGRVRKQLQLTKSMATISCFEIALMAIPNFLSFLGNLRVPLPVFIKPNNSTYTNAINSFVALFASMAFNSQFRQAAIKLLHMEKVASVFSKVAPANQVAPVIIRPPSDPIICGIELRQNQVPTTNSNDRNVHPWSANNAEGFAGDSEV